MPISTKHAPIKFGAYENIHNTVIQQFKNRDFVGSETLVFEPLAYGVFLKGNIACRGNIVVAVDKFIEILDGTGKSATVQTKWYSYNVFFRKSYNIFRYDNQDDDYLRPGHQDEHHKHVFDWRTGEESAESPVWVGAHGWPNLGEVIQEVEDWYWQHYRELPEANSYPNLVDLR